jgi:hypothetical protein
MHLRLLIRPGAIGDCILNLRPVIRLFVGES